MEMQQKPLLDGMDPELMAPLISRREAIRKGLSTSSMIAAGLALGSAPVALAVLAKDVYGQTPADILDALRFAYVLENLENEFYKAVLGTSAVTAQNNAFATVRASIPASAVAAFQQIQKHEAAHVAFIAQAITLAGSSVPPLTANDFDFTGGNGSSTPGPFVRATTELAFLLLTAQALEDTGVRAYKGQAGRLLINGDALSDTVLEAALRIHSVEARHAAKLRRIRRALNTSDTSLRFSGYVLGSGVAAAGAGNIANPPQAVIEALNAIYGGGSGPVSYNESNTSHVVFNGTAAVTINAATLANTDAIGNATARSNAAQMAFDEALTKDEVIAIVRGFIKDDAARGLP